LGLGEAAHQVLRPLEHEVPPQVRKAEQSSGFWIVTRELGSSFDRHPDTREHFSFFLRGFAFPHMNGKYGIRVPHH
jgi:hypothetical protein